MTPFTDEELDEADAARERLDDDWFELHNEWDEEG